MILYDGSGHPPSDTMDCSPLLLGDLNINLQDPWTEWEEAITDFLDNVNVVNMSRWFQQRHGFRQGLGAQWTWQQQKGGCWYQSQPDFCMARDTNQQISKTWHFNSLGSIIWTIVLSSHRSRGGKPGGSRLIIMTAGHSP
jgi:hypothetical protein